MGLIKSLSAKRTHGTISGNNEFKEGIAPSSLKPAGFKAGKITHKIAKRKLTNLPPLFTVLPGRGLLST